MRDDTMDPRDARDPNHIWLRQSITFSVNGQTRTLELALPLRPGATPEEVDALLDEADAGMRRLSQRLDAHLAEVTGAAGVAPIAPAASPAPAAAAPPASRTTALPPAAQPMPQAHGAPQPASAEHPTPHAATAPAQSALSAQPAAAPSPAPSPAPASAGPDLTRPEFLAAVGALGLDARTVMERLNVRSLNGLNLREALDLLRRQVLREGGATADPPPAPVTSQPAPPAALAASMPAPIGRARFDEEDEADEADEANDSLDFELSYPDPDDLPGDDDFGDIGDEAFAPREAPPATPPAAAHNTRRDAGPLNDVPDLDDLLAPPAPTSPAPDSAPDSAPERARAVIASLRTAHPGGQPTAQQRMAYRNIVVDQLGEAKANSVARAVWSLTPDKLGPEQYDALIRWGKQDTFAEEVEEALTLLRAEWAAQQAAQQAAGQAAQPAKPATPAARQPAQSAPQSAAQPPAQTPPARPAPRGRPAAGSRANADAPRDGAGSQGGA